MSAPPPIGFSAPPYPTEQNSNFAVPPPYTPHATPECETLLPGQAVPPSNRPAPAGYQPYSGPTAPVPGVYVPQQYGGTTVVTVQPSRQQTNQIIIVGACPSCRVGVLQDHFTCMGIFCCILFFPLGIICCLTMRARRCSNCGAQFG